MSYRATRLEYEYNNLLENADDIPPNVSWKTKDKVKYIAQFKGRPGTIQDGAYIVVDIDLTNFPDEGPAINFRNGFLHVNVYAGGKLCLYLTNKESFVSQTTLLDILCGINEVIHNPNPNDPANSSLLLAGSDAKFQEQTQRLRSETYKVI